MLNSTGGVAVCVCVRVCEPFCCTRHTAPCKSSRPRGKPGYCEAQLWEPATGPTGWKWYTWWEKRTIAVLHASTLLWNVVVVWGTSVRHDSVKAAWGKEHLLVLNVAMMHSMMQCVCERWFWSNNGGLQPCVTLWSASAPSKCPSHAYVCFPLVQDMGTVLAAIVSGCCEAFLFFVSHVWWGRTEEWWRVTGRLQFSLFSSFSWQFCDRAAHICTSHAVVLWWLWNPKLTLNWMLCFVVVPLAWNLMCFWTLEPACF